MLDLDDVSPDGYNVQGLRHAGSMRILLTKGAFSNNSGSSFCGKSTVVRLNFKQLYLHTH
jgi:hypothetical protein